MASEGDKMKICVICKKELSRKEFYKNRNYIDGLGSYCKLCTKKYHKKYRKLNALKIKIQNKKYQKLNKDKILEYKRINKTKIRDRERRYENNRRKIDVCFRLRHNLRKRIWDALHSQKSYKINRTSQLVGCSIDQLKQHLEKQFTKGMSFSNYGQWHIDHIRPCASFDLSNPEEQKKCFNYTNLQPLWARENRIKSNLINGK